MRTFIAAGLLLCSSFAYGAETCPQLAAAIATINPDFPAVVPSKTEQLFTWRASCAETPPTGEGDVVQLCQADTQDGPPVMYWLKASGTTRSTGFVSCP